MLARTASTALLLFGLAASASAQETDPLKDLRLGHPRLFWTEQDIARVREQVKTDPRLKQWHAGLRQRAAEMLEEKPVEHRLVGPRLLYESRKALHRVSTLAGLYLIDGDKRYADRAKREMLTAAGFKDWNPSHFLDVGEMTNAMGIGYDWLYDHLSPEERAAVRKGIVELGLKPGLRAFEADRPPFWTRATHNWSQVCNGGLTVGALAVADEEPDLVRKLLAYTRERIRPSMKAYAPDGGFPEGPGYWSYATRYTAYHLGALETALGTDDRLTKLPGFRQTGFFRIHSIGPSGKYFNFADAGERASGAFEMFYLARVFDEPAFYAHEASYADRDPSIFHLIWYRAGVAAREAAGLPLHALFRGQQDVAFFRSEWEGRRFYVGFKGGDNGANHSHLDLGSFVLDYGGQRFATDLGADDYNLPQYFGARRWTYYRLRTESHNTITLNGQNQAPDGKAPIVAYGTSAQGASVHAVSDLSHAYRREATGVKRGVGLLNHAEVLVQDEIQADGPVEVHWNFLTSAKADLRDKRVAILLLGQTRLRLTLLEPKDASFEVIDAAAPPPQRQQPGMRNLRVRLPQKVTSTSIVIWMTDPASLSEPPKLRPLSEWENNLMPRP